MATRPVQFRTEFSSFIYKHHHARNRVGKACDRCRIKKIKCDGKRPCERCALDNALCQFTQKRKTRERIFPKGYVEMLEQQQRCLIRGLQVLYKRITQGTGWPGSPLAVGSDGHPLTQDMLTRLGVMDELDADPEGWNIDSLPSSFNSAPLQLEPATSPAAASSSSLSSSSPSSTTTTTTTTTTTAPTTTTRLRTTTAPAPAPEDSARLVGSPPPLSVTTVIASRRDRNNFPDSNRGDGDCPSAGLLRLDSPSSLSQPAQETETVGSSADSHALLSPATSEEMEELSRESLKSPCLDSGQEMSTFELMSWATLLDSSADYEYFEQLYGS